MSYEKLFTPFKIGKMEVKKQISYVSNGDK